MFTPFPDQLQKDLYFSALAAVCLGAALLAFFQIADIKPENIFPVCSMYHLTGYYCPGCGGTRAVRALFRGDLATSFCYHPFVLYAFFMFAGFLSTSTLPYVFHRKMPFQLKLRPVHFYLAAVLVLGNWAVKNLLIYLGSWS